MFLGNPNVTNTATHQIDTDDPPPIRCSPYKVPQRLESEVNKEIDKLLEMGIILQLRFKDDVRRGTKRLAYIDNVEVDTPSTSEQHLLELPQVLARLREYNLHARPSKMQNCYVN